MDVYCLVAEPQSDSRVLKSCTKHTGNIISWSLSLFTKPWLSLSDTQYKLNQLRIKLCSRVVGFGGWMKLMNFGASQ